MVKYLFVYFNLQARGEVIRLLFKAAGEEFIDERFSFEDWPKYKPNTPFGQTPVLEIINSNGSVEKIAQSMAIARYLASKFGYYGKTELERAYIDMYADLISDYIGELVKEHLEKDPETKAKLSQRLEQERWPFHLKQFEDRIIKNKYGYLVGFELSYVDLYLHSLLDWLGDKRDSILKDYPNIKNLIGKIESNERISAYLKSRPKTQF